LFLDGFGLSADKKERRNRHNNRDQEKPGIFGDYGHPDADAGANQSRPGGRIHVFPEQINGKENKQGNAEVSRDERRMSD
jgi:hypothetical protein